MLFIINFLFLQWFHVRLYKVTSCLNGKTCGFGWITNVKPMTGWNTPYNEEHEFQDPFIFRNK